MEIWTISRKNDLLNPTTKGPTILTTVNADIYRILRKHSTLASILLKDNVCIDGRPLYYISKLIQPNLELIQGSSFIYDAAKHAAESGTAILIIGGSKLANQAAVARLKELYGCKIYGLAPETIVNDTIQQTANIIISRNVRFAFICLGAPRQELFAIELKTHLPADHNVLIIGAGGTVDFAANHLRRAPKTLQKLGLEGIYRLVKEPSKKRIIRLATSLVGLFLFAYDLTTKRIQIKT